MYGYECALKISIFGIMNTVKELNLDQKTYLSSLSFWGVRILLGFCLGLGGVWIPSHAQLQIQMTPFGSNQRQMHETQWQFMESGEHKIYYPLGMDSTAKWIHRCLPLLTSALEQQFNVRPEHPYQLLLYRNRLEWEESNLNREKYYYNIGWNFPAPGNKIPVFADQYSSTMIAQIREGITRILIADLVYGGNSFQRIQNQALLVLPSWFTEGLARYWGLGWNGSMDRELQEWVRGRTKPRYGELVRQRPDLAGTLFWHRYIRVSGEGGATRLLMAARSQRQVQAAFRSLNKQSYNEFVTGILEEYQTEIARDSVENALTRDALEILALRGIPKSRVRMDSKGKQIALVAYRGGRYRVLAYDRANKILQEVFRSQRVRRVDANSFPVIAWHPGGQRMVVVGDFGNGLFLMDFQKQADGLWVQDQQPVKEADWVQSIDWSPDGKSLVIAGSKHHQSRLMLCSLNTKQWRILLMDSLEKSDVRFVPSSKGVVFGFSKPLDSMQILYPIGQLPRQTTGICRLDFLPNSLPIILFSSDSEEVSNPLPLAGGRLIWLSDRSGYRIQYIGQWDMITETPQAVPPFALNLAWHEAGSQSTQLILGNKNLIMDATIGFRSRLDTFQKPETYASAPPVNSWRREQRARVAALLASGFVPGSENLIVRPNVGLFTFPEFLKDSSIISVEKVLTADHERTGGTDRNTPLGMAIRALFASKPAKVHTILRKGRYVRASAMDNIGIQAGNNILTGRMPLLSASPLHMLHAQPGAVTRISLSDIPEDQTLSAGALILQSLSNFQSYLLYENLKGLTDWRMMGVYSIIPAIQSYDNPGIGTAPSGPIRSSLEFYTSATYPISRSFGLSATVGHMASVDRGPLNPDNPKGNLDIVEQLSGIRLEAMWEKSKESFGWRTGGFRIKVYGEKYFATGGLLGSGNLVALEGRSYTSLMPGLVWANRLSFQHSGGTLKANYMAGGAEQWLLPRFNGDMPRPASNRVLMFALAAPVKGLPINTRNGSAFISSGTELRLAFSALRSAIPVGSDFWRSFRIYGFADGATVWNRGQFLQADSLLFPTQIIQGPVRVNLLQTLSPLLWSYGMGLRANVLGYSLRLDRAWAHENRKALQPTWVISLGLDF